MDCRSLRTISLKADGHVSCGDCSNGYSIHLGEVTASPRWDVRRIIEGPLYRQIRESLSAGEAPWGKSCLECDLFSPGGSPEDTLNQHVFLRIEPTLACDLACPNCARPQEVALRDGAWHLDVGKLQTLIRSCQKHGIGIDGVSYLGWGEPLNHPDFAGLVRAVRDLEPDAYQEVTTIANAAFATSVATAPLDVITVSCDGVTQESYERYRRGGRIGLAFEFMRDARQGRMPGTRLIWKYIVFKYNDDPADLLQAQRMADEFEVDELHFILTDTPNRSSRFDIDNIGDFPISSDRARVVSAAVYQNVKRRLLTSDAVALRSESFEGYLDDAYINGAGTLVLRGWALTATGVPVPSITGRIGTEREWKALTTTESRPDVTQAKAHARDRGVGFMLHLPEPDLGGPATSITLTMSENGFAHSFGIPLTDGAIRIEHVAGESAQPG